MVSNSKYLTKKKNAPTTSMPTLPDYLGVSPKYRMTLPASHMGYQILRIWEKARKVHFSHLLWPILSICRETFFDVWHISVV